MNQGLAKLVSLVASTEPMDILLHHPLVCGDMGVPEVLMRSDGICLAVEEM